jgi:hypothetical protein
MRGGGERMKRGMSWRSGVCGVVGGEKLKRENMLGLGIGIKPLRLSRSFTGTSNHSVAVAAVVEVWRPGPGMEEKWDIR